MPKFPKSKVTVNHITYGEGEVIGAKLTFGRSLPCLVVRFDGRTREIVVEPQFWRELDDRITQVFQEFLVRETARQEALKRKERIEKRKAALAETKAENEDVAEAA